jgi:hypothetical protein
MSQDVNKARSRPTRSSWFESETAATASPPVLRLRNCCLVPIEQEQAQGESEEDAPAGTRRIHSNRGFSELGRDDKMTCPPVVLQDLSNKLGVV